MRLEYEGAIVAMPPATTATNATQSMVFSTVGYDSCVIDVLVGTHATNGASISTLKLSESDSSTSITNHSDIAKFTGGTQTSSTVGFVIPGADVLGEGSVIEFQVDLRARKRYLALQITPGTTTMQIGAIARLTRSKESADSASEKSGVTNYAATSMVSCAKVVSG